MSTDLPLIDGTDTTTGTSPGGDPSANVADRLAAQTHALAGSIAAAFSAGSVELVAGPADVQDGPEDLLPPGAIHGVIAGLRETSAVQVVLILGDSVVSSSEMAAVTPRSDLPEPWMAPVAAAMESWAGDLGGMLVNAMPVSDAQQLDHLLISTGGTTLVASGLFDGPDLVGSVAVVGRADDPVDASPIGHERPAGHDDAPHRAVPTDGRGTLPAGTAAPTRSASAGLQAMHVLAEVEMKVTAELGRTRMSVAELLALAPGSLIELDRTAGSPIDLLVNGTLIARGEVVVVDEEYGIRLTEITGSPES